MVYSKKPPELKDLRDIASAIKSWPAKASELATAAVLLGHSKETVDLIKQFSIGNRDEVFQSREEFYVRSTELALLIREETAQPVESLPKL